MWVSRWQLPASAFTWLDVPPPSATSVRVPRGEPQSTPATAPPGDSPRPAGRPGPGSYQITSLALGLGARRLVWLLKREISVFRKSCGAPASKPCWPSESRALGACSPGAGPRGRGGGNIWLRPLPPVGEALSHDDSPAPGSPTWRVWDLITSQVHPSYPSHCGPFLTSLEDLLWWVPVFFVHGGSAGGCDFGCS